MEMSPYIYPPFKIATSWSNGLGVKDVVELHTPDVSRSTRVFAVEFRCEFQSKDFGGRFPGIVFTAVSFLLNEILESSPVPTAVKYLLHFLLRFSIDDYGRWMIYCFPSCDRVIWSQSKLHYVEYWVELLHPVW